MRIEKIVGACRNRKKCGKVHHHHVINPPVLHGFSHRDTPSNDILLTKSVEQTSDLLRVQKDNVKSLCRGLARHYEIPKEQIGSANSSRYAHYFSTESAMHRYQRENIRIYFLYGTLE